MTGAGDTGAKRDHTLEGRVKVRVDEHVTQPV